MGKYIILITVAVAASTQLLSYSSQSTQRSTDQRQAQRQEKIIARQIARSGYNMALAQAREEEALGKKVKQIVHAVGTIQGQYQGGAYKAWLKQVSPTAYRVKAKGTYNAATHRINVPYDQNIVPDPPKVTQPSQLEVEFIESMAGYCSAIFLQRFVPAGSSGHDNNGHGNNCDGVDSSNPGQSPFEDSDPDDDECEGGDMSGSNGNNGKLKKLEPELVFAPGNNRDGTSATFDKVIEPGTLLNFILAVDADYTCERRGDSSITIEDAFFDYTRQSFKKQITKLSELREMPYALTQESPTESGTWRVAFEDLIFSDEELWTIKENGYDGNGWNIDGNGFWELKDFGHKPDFSDQVIKVKIVPADGDESELVAEEDRDSDRDDNDWNHNDWDHRHRGDHSRR